MKTINDYLNALKGLTPESENNIPTESSTESTKLDLPDTLAVKLIQKGRVTPIETISVTSWLEKLSDSEREIFEERSAIIEVDAGLPRELAEIEAIKRIIQERIVPGKCDECDRVQGCLLTKKHRELCEGPSSAVKPRTAN